MVAFAVALAAYAVVIAQARRDYTDVRRTIGSVQLLGVDATRLQNAASDAGSGSLLLGVRVRRRSSGEFAFRRLPAFRYARFANVLIAADAFVSLERIAPEVELVSPGKRTLIPVEEGALTEIALSPSRTNGYRLPISVPRRCATSRCSIVLHVGRGRWRIRQVALTAEDAPNAPSQVP